MGAKERARPTLGRRASFGPQSRLETRPLSKCSASHGTIRSISATYRNSPKLAQFTGPENIGLERPLPGLQAQRPVLSPTRITLENNGKIRPQPDRENAFARACGGGGGIRTHGALARTPVFKTGAIDHSATPPACSRAAVTGSGVILKPGPCANHDQASFQMRKRAVSSLSIQVRPTGRDAFRQCPEGPGHDRAST